MYYKNVTKDLHKDFKYLGGVETIFDSSLPSKKDNASKRIILFI